ncbi:hypothetical protein ASG36_06605 [Geodermatophilus sp. Leaf369]|uniref:hypothetical protein n=1 Tax=Geodermatophilus sp. Leaf369 TaxID=1736354 RepID=UPI0006F4CE0A|nr:hypothetical protein [Geodermatophilus sp. Leaf369]KQS60569.1 hypothetical protein ASG36_06605 [Geodermatophilus sp. Leaf369]
MPQSHPSSRTGRRLLTTGLLSAVVVLGTPAIASAAPALPSLPSLPLPGLPLPTGTATPSPTVSPAVPTSGAGLPSLPGAGALPDPLESVSAGAACVDGLATGIQMSVTDIVGGLAGLGGLLAGLPGGDLVPVPGTSSTSAATTIPLSIDDLRDLLGPERLAELLAGGQEDVTAQIEVVIGGVTSLVPVVLDFVSCLAALVPTAAPAAPTTTAPVAPAAPTTTAPAPTSAPAAVQPVAYPGYAPTGGAPGEESHAPLALAGLGVLSAAGASALWLRGRRGVTG